MSFLIKQVLKKLLRQYLNIVDDISMEKGAIKLPSGHLNHDTINNNQQLIKMGIKIVSSQYIGLSVSIPIMEILSKPIILKAEALNMVIQIDDAKRNNGQNSSQMEETIPTETKEIEISPNKNRKEPNSSQKQPKQENDKYIKGLANRILANMELQLKKLELIIIHKQKNQVVRSYQLTIDTLIIKNSLSLLQANLLKKIVCLASIKLQRIKSDSSMIEIKNDDQVGRNQEFMLAVFDLNMSLNIDYKKINAIILLDKIQLKVQLKVIEKIINYVQRTYKPKKQENLKKKGIIKKNVEKKIQNLKQNSQQDKIQLANPKNTEISLESLSVKINYIELMLVEMVANQAKQLYSITVTDMQILKELVQPRNINKENQITIQTQRILLKRQNIQTLEIGVNKMNQDNILDRLYQNQFQGISSNSLGDYDKVIKNKKRQCMFKICQKKNKKLTLEIDTLAIIINLSIQTIKDVARLLKFINPHITDLLQIVNNQNKTDKSNAEQSFNFEATLIQSDTSEDNYDIIATLKNIALDFRICNKKETLVSLCILNSQATQLKFSKREKLISLNDKILVYLQNLKVLSVSQINVAILKDLTITKQQIILSIKQIVLQTDLAQLIPTIQHTLKFIEDRNIQELIQIISHCSGIIQNASPIVRQVEEDMGQIKPIQKASKQIPIEISLRINRFLASIGQLNSSRNYLPIFLLQITSIKSAIASQMKKLKFYISSVSCISPHNLSSSLICGGNNSPESLKNQANNNGKIQFFIQSQHSNTVKIQIKDPLNIQLQEQQVCLLLNIIDSIRYLEAPKKTMYIQVTNQTNQNITLKSGKNHNSSPKSTSSKKILLKQAKQKPIIFEDQNIFKSQIPCEYNIAARSAEQIFLTSFNLQVVINGEISQIIKLNNSQKSDDLGVIQLPIVFSYQEECSYIMQIKTKFPNLQLVIKAKYQLYVFEGISDELNYIQKMRIQSDKPEKQLIYIKNQISENKKNQQEIQINKKISFGWELLEDQKLDSLSFHMSTTLQNHPKILKVSRLISNNIHYKLYGLYAPQNITSEDLAIINTQKQLNSKYNYFYYYILQELSASSLVHQNQINQNLKVLHKYYLMPFLILANKLQDSDIQIRVSNKKLDKVEKYYVNKGQELVAFGGPFDYYMKQYTIQIQIEQKMLQINRNAISKDKQKKQLNINEGEQILPINQLDSNKITFESEEHYFNTFFMVDESFESPIQLRSSGNKKRYLRVCQSFIKKTKILTIQNHLILINRADVPLILDLAMSNAIKSTKQSKQKSILLQSKSKIKNSQKLKKGDTLSVSYICGDSKNRIEVPISSLLQSNNKVVLSFNFCKLQKKVNQNNQIDKQQYFQILLKMQFVEINHTQTLTFSPFVTFNNICSQKKTLKVNNYIIKSHNDKRQASVSDSISLYLPSNTNKDYNNRWVPLNIEKIYEDLFIKHDTWILEGDSNLMQIEIGVDYDYQEPKIDNSIKFYQLLAHKIIEHNNSVYSLVKSMKDDAIQFYFSDRLFNTNISNARYFIINNQTSQSFLMSSAEQEYAKYLLFPQKRDQNQSILLNTNRNNTGQTAQQKIFIPSVSHQRKSSGLNILLNKDRYDIFLCDSHKKKLESFNSKKLQKLKIKQERYTIQNFTVVNLEQSSESKSKSQGVSKNPELQILTSNFNLKFVSKRKKIHGIMSCKSFTFRILESGKFDTLIKDIGVTVVTGAKPSKGIPQQSKQIKPDIVEHHQILRIPQETYLLIESKNFEEKIVLIKNIFIKCKIIDLHINKQLLQFLAVLQKFGKQTASGIWNQDNLRKEKQISQSQKFLDFKYGNNKKIIGLVQEKLFLVRSIYLHQANLCLNVKTTGGVDFSNLIALPEFTASNKCYKLSSLAKDISNLYVTTIIAKFPKLSYLYQNLRSPISMIKSLIEAKDTIIQKDKMEQKRKYLWLRSYIQLQNLYDSYYPLKSSKSTIKNHSNSSKKIDLHNAVLSTFLSKQYWSQGSQAKERILCKLKNIIFSNISKQLPISASSQPEYILTNRNIYILVYIPMYSPGSNLLQRNFNNTKLVDNCIENSGQYNILQEKISLKEIEYVKILRYNSQNGQLIVTFRKKGVMLKIVDTRETCENILNYLRGAIV